MFMNLVGPKETRRGRGRPRKNVSMDGLGVFKPEVNEIVANMKRKAGMGVNKDIERGIRKVSAKTKRGFNKTIVDSGIGKEIASALIDVGADVILPAGTTALSMALGDPTGLSGAVVGKVAGDQIQKAAEKKGYGMAGYGMKGKALTTQKKVMAEYFKQMGLAEKQAKALTNKVFREGEQVLDRDEVKISGGKINLKGVRKDLLKGAKEIWREARPVLKFAGETALDMAEPFVESGIRTVAVSYGVDPEVADMSAKMFTATAREKAQQGLNKLSKKKSKNPQEYVDRASSIIQDKSSKYIAQAEKKGLEQVSKSGLSDEAKQLAMDSVRERAEKAQNIVDLNVEKVESQIQNAITSRRRRGVQDTNQDSTGGMGILNRNDMSTLLSYDSVAKQPFYTRPNIPQGSISGISGGSLYADTMQGSSFMGSSFRNVSGTGFEKAFKDVYGFGDCSCGGMINGSSFR